MIAMMKMTGLWPIARTDICGLLIQNQWILENISGGMESTYSRNMKGLLTNERLQYGLLQLPASRLHP